MTMLATWENSDLTSSQTLLAMVSVQQMSKFVVERVTVIIRGADFQAVETHHSVSHLYMQCVQN